MRSRTTASVLNLIFNYTNSLFLVVNGILLLPIYLTFFTLEVYGSYMAITSIVGMIGLLDGGISLVLTQQLSKSIGSADASLFSRRLSSAIALASAFSLLILVVGLCVLPFVPQIVKAPPATVGQVNVAYLILLLSAALQVLFHVFSAPFQAWLRVEKSGFANLFGVIAGLVVTLLSLSWGLGIVSIAAGFLAKIGSSLAVVMTLLVVEFRRRRVASQRPTLSVCLEIFRASWPVQTGSFVKSVVDTSQLLVITVFLNPLASGLYVVTSRVYQICTTLLAPIGSSIFSGVSQMHGEGGTARVKASVLKVSSLFVTFAIFLLTMTFALNGAFVALWLGPERFGGTLLSFLICVSVFATSRTTFLGFNLSAIGMFGKTSLFDQVGAIVRFLVMVALIGWLGVIAVPIGEIVGVFGVAGFFVSRTFVRSFHLDEAEARQFIFDGLLSFAFCLLLAFGWNVVGLSRGGWITFLWSGALFGVLTLIMLSFLRRKTEAAEVARKWFGRFFRPVA